MSPSISSGATTTARRLRMASMATLRVMLRSQLSTRPRRTSKVSARRQARTIASWAASSADRGSPTMVRASPYTRRW